MGTPAPSDRQTQSTLDASDDLSTSCVARQREERAASVRPALRRCARAQTRDHHTHLDTTGERSSSVAVAFRRTGINLTVQVWSQCCARRFTACACSSSEFFRQRTTWPRKQRRQRKPRRQPPRRWQRRLPRKRSNLVYDEQIAAPGCPEAIETSPKDLKSRLRPSSVAATDSKAGPLCR
jgi:hypothetical protein